MATPAIGHQVRLAIDSALPFDSGSKSFEFLSETMQRRQTIIDGGGIRGTRSHSKEVTRFGTYTCSGTIVMNPSHLDLDELLPRILGGAESANTFPLAETVPEFYFGIDRITRGFVYEGCKVSRAVFSGSEGALLTLSMDIEAEREGSDNAGVFVETTLENGGFLAAAGIPALGTTDDNAPFAFTDLAIVMQSLTVPIKSFELTIDNALIVDRFMNSTSRAHIPEGDRIISLRATCPYSTDEVTLYNQALAGAAATLTFTNTVGGAVLVFTLAALQVGAVSPVVNGKGEIMLEIDGIARMSGSTRELVVTNAP